jgi:hypothetical protein
MEVTVVTSRLPFNPEAVSATHIDQRSFIESEIDLQASFVALLDDCFDNSRCNRWRGRPTHDLRLCIMRLIKLASLRADMPGIYDKKWPQVKGRPFRVEDQLTWGLVLLLQQILLTLDGVCTCQG